MDCFLKSRLSSTHKIACVELSSGWINLPGVFAYRRCTAANKCWMLKVNVRFHNLTHSRFILLPGEFQTCWAVVWRKRWVRRSGNRYLIKVAAKKNGCIYLFARDEKLTAFGRMKWWRFFIQSWIGQLYNFSCFSCLCIHVSCEMR